LHGPTLASDDAVTFQVLASVAPRPDDVVHSGDDPRCPPFARRFLEYPPVAERDGHVDRTPSELAPDENGARISIVAATTTRRRQPVVERLLEHLDVGGAFDARCFHDIPEAVRTARVREGAC